MNDGTAHNPLDRGAIDPDTLTHLREFLLTLTDLGIVDGVPELGNSHLTPRHCMESAQNRLRFCGLGGNKWKDEPWFEDGISRLREHAGNVQFLLPVDTAGDARSVDRYQELTDLYYPTLKIGFFKEPPLFRIVIVDDAYTVLSHYRYRREPDRLVESAAGWKKPQLLLRHQANWSLGHAFLVLFKELRSRSELMLPSSGGRATRRFDTFRPDEP